MIADHPDEDADFTDPDSLDDDELFSAYLGAGTSKRESDPEPLPDWPPPRVRDTGLNIDIATLDWFKSNHADWRREMALVLRAWVVAQQPAEKTMGQPSAAPSSDLT